MITSDRSRELLALAYEIRKNTLKSIASIGIGHIGGSLSVAEVLSCLYFEVMNIAPENPRWPDRDRLVMSKGHCGPALYSALAMRGYFSTELLYTLNQPDTLLPSHCDMKRTPGIDMTTGSLGQGISAAMGIALANRLDKRKNYVYFIIGDGECQEGEIWEAAMFASHHRLDRVIGFLDYNRLQIDGTTDEVCSLGDIGGKFEKFGWHVQSIDGHDPGDICTAIEHAKTVQNQPSMIILHTVKGKGIRCFENRAASHNAAVDKKTLCDGLWELDARIREVMGQ